MLFIWNVALFVSVAVTTGAGEFASISGVLDISDIMKSFDQDKSQLNKGK